MARRSHENPFMSDHPARRPVGKLLWSAVAVLISIGVLFVAFRNLDLERLPGVLMRADPLWIAAVAVAIPLEQLVRSWKWRQILYDIRPIGSLRLFGAVMAGYFVNILVPVGVSPLVRAWLIARLESLTVATVLLTSAIERFIDGIVFSLIVGGLLVFATLPTIDGDLRLGLMVAGGGTLILFSALIGFLFRIRKRLGEPDSFIGRNVAGLEKSFGGRLAGLGDGMAQGITWPQSRLRGCGIIIASIVMKAISTSHFLWAGLAFGVVLAPFDYLFIMVFTGFALIVSRFIRIPGGGVIGSAYALKLLDVADEEALTMVLVVHTASMIMIALIGALAMWKSGLTMLSLRQYLNRQGG